MTGSEISIANLFALFAAIPSVVLTKIFTFGKNLVPSNRLDEFTSWRAKDIRSYSNDQHSLEMKETRSAVDLVLNDIYPLFTGFSRLYSDGVIKIMSSLGSQIMIGPLGILNWVLFVLSDIPIPERCLLHPLTYRPTYASIFRHAVCSICRNLGG